MTFTARAAQANVPIVCLHDGDNDREVTGTYGPDWRTYYTTDALGSVTGSFRFDSDDTLVATSRNVYTAYGEATRSGPDTNFDGPLYAGYFFDAQTGLYQVRNRYYDPNLSNFISRDPIGYDADDPNLYRYVANGPLGATDAMGLQDPRREIERLTGIYLTLAGSSDAGDRALAIQVRNEIERWQEIVTGEFPAHRLREMDAIVRYNNPLTHVGEAIAKSNVGTTLGLLDKPRQITFYAMESGTSVTRDELAAALGFLGATRQADGGRSYNPTSDSNMWLYYIIVDQAFDPLNYVGAVAAKGMLGRGSPGANRFGLLDDAPRKGAFFRSGSVLENLPSADAERMLGIAKRQAQRLGIDPSEVYGVKNLGGQATGATMGGRIHLDPRAFRQVYDPRLGRTVSPMENLKRNLIHEHGHVLQSSKHPDLYWSGTPASRQALEKSAYRFEDFWYGATQSRAAGR